MTFVADCEVECSLKREQGTDWLNDVADGFSYRFLENQGVVQDSDFTSVPYCINYVPDGLVLLTLGMSVFALTKELIEVVKAVGNRIADVVDAAVPVVSAVAPAGVGTGYDIGNIILNVLKLAVTVAYGVAIVVALVKLTEQIVEELMPKKR